MLVPIPNLRFWLLASLVFLFIYSFKFSFFPVFTSRLILLGLIFWTMLNVGKLPRIRSDLLIIIGIYLILLVYICVRNAENSSADISLLTGYVILGVESIAGSLMLAMLIVKSGFGFSSFSKMFVCAAVIQAIFIILYFITPSFKFWVSQNIPLISNFESDHEIFMSRGLTHSPGATLSLVQSLGLLFVAQLITKKRALTGAFFFAVSYFLIILFSIFLTGRTGLLMIPFVFAFIIFNTSKFRYINKSAVSFLFIVPLLSTFFVIIALYFGEFIIDGTTMAWGEGIVDRVARWVVSAFINEDGKLGSKTVEGLIDHWFLPESTKSFIFGDVTTWNTKRIVSDVGYVRTLHGIGVIGFVCYYLLIFMTMLASFIYARENNIKLLITIVYIFLFLVETKEPFFSKLYINKVMYLIFFVLLFSRYNDSNDSSKKYILV